MAETIITSSVLILIIIILRTVFKGRIKSSVRYALWLIAAIRLVMPFSIVESSVSIMNLIRDISVTEQMEVPAYIPYEVSYPAEQPVYNAYNESSADIYSEKPAAPYYGYDAYTESYPEGNTVRPERKPFSVKKAAVFVWIFAASVMLIWFTAVNVIFYVKLRRSRKEVEYPAPLKIYRAEGIISPCIFGTIKPSIYIPASSACDDSALEFVVTHELCHYYHGDMIWAALRYVLLAVYWFDPLVWAAAVLSKQDCECACDEAAIHRVGEDKRFEYGKAVIDLIPQKRGEMFGIASTSMASSKKVLKERMTMIAAKPKNRIYALMLSLLAVILAACGTFTSAKNNEEIVIDDAEAENTVNETAVRLPFENEFYITVTDYTGADKLLHYVSPPDSSFEAFVYMNDMSDVYGSVPARSEDAYSGSSMKEFIENSRFSKADITFAGETKTLTRSANPEELSSLSEAVCSLSPEYCPEAVSGEPTVEVVFSRENGGFSSSLTIELYTIGDRIAGRITAEDYSEIISLITSESQPPRSEKLTDAYNSSVRAVSELFYAEETELYKIIEKLLDTEASPMPEIMKYESFSADLFSEKLSGLFGVTGEIPEGYIMTQTGNVLLGVPYQGNVSNIGTLLLWQTKNMSLRITQNGISSPPEGSYSETGSFDGRDCTYYEDTAKHEVGLIFSDYEGISYSAVLEYKTEDGIDTAKKIFGSIHLTERPAPAVYVSPIPLSSEPSIYGDENYGMADTDYWYTSSFRANAPAMLVAGFQITNGVKDYETNFDCYIEKKEPDGKWYRVLPLAEIVQVNNSYRHFYTEDESGHIPCCLDLSCYPLLPAGTYRLVKPFRLKGSDRDEYAALFDFYMSDGKKPLDELLCTAECPETEIFPNAKSITYEVKANKVGFALSEIVDIEKETSAGWRSVRTGRITTNTLHASFPLAFAGTYTLDTSDFDISTSGNYRIRLSYGDGGFDLNVPGNGYDTAYAYFKVI
ncbi:MAG: hypothetical protein J1E40_07695 [Oscillospiraceae bacterium]|nr:hypothetical protein [Oscillospiraceae bacterium]